jgi:hypothetical protein
MSGPVYKTYDAIRAMAEAGWTVRNPGVARPRIGKDQSESLFFYGKIRPTLANHTNSSLTQLYEHIETLLKDGWLQEVEPPDGRRERSEKGHLKPVMYYVFNHDEWLHFGAGRKCPEYKFKSDDGQRVEKSEQPVDFQMIEALKHPAGKIALRLARAAGQLPGKDWDEVMKNLRKNPDNMPKKVKP